jgi:hypothetical protein
VRRADGSHGSRATQRELCECYAEPMLADLAPERIAAVADERFAFFLSIVYIHAERAAHHGRRALRQVSR